MAKLRGLFAAVLVAAGLFGANVAFAQTAPQLNSISLASPVIVTAGDPVSYSFVITPGPAVTIAFIAITIQDPSGNAYTIQQTGEASGVASLTSASSWQNGSYTVAQIQVQDSSGILAVYSPNGTVSYPAGGTGPGTHAISFPSLGFLVTGGTIPNPTLAPAITGEPQSVTVNAGSGISLSVTATGSGTLAYQWSQNGTALPGATSATYAVASATTSNAGSYTVTVMNSNGSVTSTPATVTVVSGQEAPPAITSATTAFGAVGTAFDDFILGSNSPTSFNATGLPAGLSVNTVSGLISGTPTVAGTFSVTISASNAGGTGSAVLTLTIEPPPFAPAITSAASATGTVGSSFDYFIVGSNSPVSFNATGLPAGLSVAAANGLISGTPTTAGTYSVTVSATNAAGTGTATLTLTIDPPPPPPVITSATSATGTVGIAFNYDIVASNSPTSFGATGLPAGLYLTLATPNVGAIAGTPTATGTYTVEISATNAAGTGTATLTLTIDPPPPAPVITSAVNATATTGTVFSYLITATSSPVSFNATGLPAGLSVNTGTGTISGIPMAAGTYSVAVSATNASGTGTATLSLVVVPGTSTARLINLSARAGVGTGSNILIAGFVVAGTGSKSMLIRGAGPALGALGVTGYLAQPSLGLFNSQSVEIAANTGWNNAAALSATFAQVGAFAFPAGSADSAMQVSLPAGASSFTAEVSGVNNGTGVALAELYDADPDVLGSTSRLVNISARADVGTGANILIAGFVIGGSGSETVLIRGIGPMLSSLFGLTGVLANPVLTLFDAKGNVITSNQGWQNPPATPSGTWAGIALPIAATHADFTNVGAFDLGSGSADSALIVTLPAGAYTAEITGLNGTTGVALVEVYEDN